MKDFGGIGLGREVKDRRNNDVLRVWYHAEAWLELIRLVAHDRW
jgi:hypothetical protein